MKKVISFSLWGDKPFYNVGALRNVELAKQHFEGWVCRFYIGTSTPKDTIQKLESHDNVEVVAMNDDEGWNGMFWRFYAISDPDVDVMISRDVDSRLSNRDSCAVNEWIESGKKLHIMRDHPMHGEPMMGGMWGCRTKEITFDNIKETIHNWLKEERINLEGFHGVDQKFLRRFLYEPLYKEAFIHDSFPIYNSWSGRFEVRLTERKEQNTGFPTKRIDWNDFIGQVYDENDVPNITSSEFLKQRDECIYMDAPVRK